MAVNAAPEAGNVGVVVPYWPLHATKLAAVSGLSALIFLGVLMHVRPVINPISSDPAPVFRGVLSTGDDDGPKFKTYSADDLNSLVMMLWFVGLGTVTLYTQLLKDKVDKNGVPYWPLRAARVASTTALSVMIVTGILSRIRDPPPATVLRGALSSASAADNAAVGGLDLSFAVVALWFCCLGAIALFTNFYCTGKGFPYWPLRAARVASTSALCAFAFFSVLSKLRTPTSGAVLRGAVIAAAPASPGIRGFAVKTVTDVAPAEVLRQAAVEAAGGQSYGKFVFQCVGALLVLLAFGSHVYSQATTMLKFRDGFDGEPKKVTKKQ